MTTDKPPLIGAYAVTPYVRLFPIWKYGPIYSLLDGRYLRDGWHPEIYGQRRTRIEYQETP